jgi:hypothetical protein
VLTALPEDMVGQILDTPYTFLKTGILEKHQLSDYEKYNMLVKMEDKAAASPVSCWQP